MELETIYATLKLQIKTNKIKADNKTNIIKLTILLDKDDSPLILFIPKFIENEQFDMDELLKYKTKHYVQI